MENILNSDYFFRYREPQIRKPLLCRTKIENNQFSNRNTIITQLLMLRKGVKEYHCESPLKVSNDNLKRKLPEK